MSFADPSSDPNAFVYDRYDGPVNVPNADELLDKIILILEKKTEPEMMKLKKEEYAVYQQKMEEYFPEFADRYYGLFSTLLGDDNIDPLWDMLEEIKNVNTGKSKFEESEQRVGQMLTKFLPPKLLKDIQSGKLKEKDLKPKIRK